MRDSPLDAGPGDRAGYPRRAPYSRIIATAALRSVPQALPRGRGSRTR
ncbi:hypothetical protein [Streptomyces sp. NBC_01198]|nr:hypothetical protein OG702_14640 [Streptomyces sp. NBC_01198]